MNVAKRRVAAAVLGRAALRFVPGLGLLITAYELYQWFNGVSPMGAIHNTNPSGPLDGGFYTLGPNSVAGTHNPVLPAGQNWIGAPASSITTTAAQNYVRVMHRNLSAPSPYVFQRQCLGPFATGTVVRYGARPVLRWSWQQPKIWESPLYEPWFDPSLPPQMQPARAKRPDPYRRLPPNHPMYIPHGDPIELPQRDPYRPWDPPINPYPKPKPRRRVRVKPRRPPPYWDPLPRPKVPVPNPVIDPPPWPDTTPASGVTPAPGPTPHPWPGPGPSPLPAVRTPPGWQVDVSPQPGVAPPRMRPAPPPTNPVTPPPSPRGKETKLGARRAGLGWLLWAFNFTTEAKDFIEAVYKALPCALRSRKDNTPVKMMQRIYDNFEALDWNAAVSELVLNHIEDYIIGRARGAISKGFGSDRSWANYMRQIGMDRTTGFGKALGKNVNDILDEVANRMGLYRIKCGR